MRSLEVVEVEVVRQAKMSLGRRQIVVQVHLLVIDRAPQPLSEDIVHVSSTPIHADLDIGRQQTAEILRACEVAALVTVPDDWRGLLQRSLNSVQDKG